VANPFDRAARILDAAGATLYIDVSPLLDEHWTGVQTASAGLTRVLHARLPRQVRFFLDTHAIAPAPVAEALRRRTGLFLQREIETGRALDGFVPMLQRAGLSIGLYPSVKRQRRVFDVEASLYHDLSTLVMPQFHTGANIALQTDTILDDLASNDLILAVSHATRNDLVAYLDVAEGRIAVTPNGVSWPEDFPLAAANLAAHGEAEPFVLMLGTREPRKNARLVFDLLEAHPEWLASHRFVFCGRTGWLDEQAALPAALRPAAAAGRLLFPGYVSELEKYLLLHTAELTLYPSWFEGFGLPILESLSAGTPVVASWTSSLPEVGGDLCTYFDPFSVEDCHRAMLEMRGRIEALGPAMQAACRAHASHFTWEAAAIPILHGLERVILRRLRMQARAEDAAPRRGAAPA
jgi:glycosyltransferase involved in cell wall biosynthesis